MTECGHFLGEAEARVVADIDLFTFDLGAAARILENIARISWCFQMFKFCDVQQKSSCTSTSCSWVSIVVLWVRPG